MIEISIIMPVYNLEKFLSFALDSIIAQTFRDFELIIIDDGSTDGSANICDQYASIDKRINVIHQKNQGVSVARNCGLDLARGKYIAFIDGDDWIEPVMLEIMHDNATRNDSDVVVCDYRDDFSSGEVYSGGNITGARVSTYYDSKALEQLLLLPSFCCTKLYKSSSINSIRFQKGIVHAEDLLFLIMASKNIVCLTFVNEKLYVYRKRPDSAVQRPFYKEFLASIIIAEYCVFEILQRDIRMRDICYFRVYRSIYQALGKLEQDKDNREKNTGSILFLQSKVRLYLLTFLKNPYISLKLKVMSILFAINTDVYFEMKPEIKKIYSRFKRDS